VRIADFDQWFEESELEPGQEPEGFAAFLAKIAGEL
jgi:hypothetical protein